MRISDYAFKLSFARLDSNHLDPNWKLVSDYVKQAVTDPELRTTDFGIAVISNVLKDKSYHWLTWTLHHNLLSIYPPSSELTSVYSLFWDRSFWIFSKFFKRSFERDTGRIFTGVINYPGYYSTLYAPEDIDTHLEVI